MLSQFRYAVAAAALSIFAVSTAAHAQAQEEHKPGGLNKVAHNVSKTMKKAGSDTKAEKNRVKSNVHGELTETGKSVKDTTLKFKP